MRIASTAFDVANTILATSQAFHEVADIIYDGNIKDTLKININAFKKGSLITDFLLFLDDNKDTLIPLVVSAPQEYAIGKEILITIKTLVEIRIALRGKPPKDVSIKSDGLISIVGDNNNVTFNVTPKVFRTLQDKAVSRNIAKSIEPLMKDNSMLDTIEIFDNYVKSKGFQFREGMPNS